MRRGKKGRKTKRGKFDRLIFIAKGELNPKGIAAASKIDKVEMEALKVKISKFIFHCFKNSKRGNLTL